MRSSWIPASSFDQGPTLDSPQPIQNNPPKDFPGGLFELQSVGLLKLAKTWTGWTEIFNTVLSSSRVVVYPLDDSK